MTAVCALAVSLALTLALEGLFGWIWGVKGKKDWGLLVLVNLITNPIVVSVHHWVCGTGAMVVVLELSAVAVEWLAYRRWGRTLRPALLFSLCANCFSYFSGVLINLLFAALWGGI